jgi:hypothetical protein
MSIWSGKENKENQNLDSEEKQKELKEIEDSIAIIYGLEEQTFKHAMKSTEYQSAALAQTKTEDMSTTELLLLAISSSMIANNSREHAKSMRSKIKDQVILNSLQKN